MFMLIREQNLKCQGDTFFETFEQIIVTFGYFLCFIMTDVPSFGGSFLSES